MKYLLLFLLSLSVAQADNVVRFSDGTDISNSLQDEKSHAWDIAFTLPSGRHTYVFGYLNEGHKESAYGKRDGFYLQDSINHALTDRLTVGMAGGVYMSQSTVADNSMYGYSDQYHVSGLISLSADYRLSRRYSIGGVFHRVMFTGNKDADVFLLSAKYHFTN